jgi:hypothetical protein
MYSPDAAQTITGINLTLATLLVLALAWRLRDADTLFGVALGGLTALLITLAIVGLWGSGSQATPVDTAQMDLVSKVSGVYTGASLRSAFVTFAVTWNPSRK